MDEEGRKRFDAYSQVYDGIDAHSISQEEESKFEEGKQELTYGDCFYHYLAPFLSLVEPKDGEVFWDIGCGGAKPVAIMALEHPGLKMCKGVEISPGLY